MNQDPATELHIVLTQSLLQEALQDVPEDIRSWFGSEKTTYFIMELNKRLGLQEERRRILPRLLLRLEVKDIHPANFVDILAQELQIGPRATKSIAEEIKETILKPIEPSLSEWDINIDLIDIVGAPPFEELVPSKEKVVKEAVPAEKEEEPPSAPTFAKATEGKPLVIHKEEVRVAEPKKRVARKSFSFSPGMFLKTKVKPSTPAPQARVEIPKKRTVHYSELRTPVPRVSEESFIDLTKLGPVTKGEIPYSNIQAQPKIKKEGQKKIKKPEAGGAKLEGNIVDLRSSNT